jgi:hypothetical protein
MMDDGAVRWWGCCLGSAIKGSGLPTKKDEGWWKLEER